MRDCKSKTKTAIVNMHPSKGTHWNTFLHEYFADSSGFPQPILLTKGFLTRNGNCVIQNKKSKYKTVTAPFFVSIDYT